MQFSTPIPFICFANNAPKIFDRGVGQVHSLYFTIEVKMPRYKLAVQVVIGELKGQGIRVASKCLWDPAYDDWASYNFTNVGPFLNFRRMDCMRWAWYSDAIMNNS